MQIITEIAAISWPARRWPRPRASSASGDRSPTRGRRRPPRSACRSRPPSASRPMDVAEDVPARGRLHRYPLRESGRRLQRAGDDRERRGRLRRQLRRHGRLPSGCGPAAHRARRLARRLLRAVRARADPQRQRPEGPARRHPDARLERPSVPLDHGDVRRPRPPAGHRVGRAARSATPWSCSPPARPTPFSAFRPSRRSCARAASTG